MPQHRSPVTCAQSWRKVICPLDDMANIIRSAKCGSDWTINELLGFNIEVQTVNAISFFGHDQLPLPAVSPTILNHLEMPIGPLSKTDRQFFHYLRDAMRSSGEESTVADFAAFILRMLDYDDGDRIIHQRKEPSFVMCGQRVDARTDVCLMSFTDYLLLVQEDKLVAEALAAFYQNNMIRERAGLPRLAAKVFPGIAIFGTAPIFYKVPVTEELLTSVATAMYPHDTTVVQRFIPPVPRPELYVVEGMKPLANRSIVLQCFEVFKALVHD